MPNFTLPPNHHIETLTPYSPAVYGRLCAVTGEPLRRGDEVVVCDAVPGSDPMTVAGWATLGSCPHCGVATGAIVYVPPVWEPAPAWVPASPQVAPQRERSPALVGGLVGLFLLALAAMAVAIFLFVFRTRQPSEPLATGLPIAAQTATAAATMTAANSTATTAPNATATTALNSPTPPPAPPSKTPEPTAAAPTPTPAPTLAPTTAPSDSPITSLILINPNNERTIRALRADDSIDLSDIGRNRLTVLADVDSTTVESVMFLLDGEPFCPRGNCVENTAPYYMGGDQGGDAYDDWDWSQMLGSHTLTAIACTGDSGTGSCFPPVEVRLTVSR